VNSRQLTISSYGIASVLTGLCYLGSVRSSAVWLYILPAIGITALATFAPRNPTPLTCLLSGLICGMFWAVIVNDLSGNNLGPVARSTTVCVVGTTLVVTGLRRGDPNTSLIGQLLNLSGALFYGAANEVWQLALLAMVFQLAGHIGSSQEARKSQLQMHSWRKYLLFLLLFLVGITTFSATPLQQIGLLQRDSPLQSLILTGINVKPPWNSTQATTTTLAETATAIDDTTATTAPSTAISTTTTLGETATTIDDTTTTTTATPTTSTTTLVLNADAVPDEKSKFSWWIVVLTGWLLLLILLCVAILRVFYVYILFERVTRRWRNQKVRQSISASWKWTTLVLRAYGFQIPPATSLEQIGNGVGVEHLPASIQKKCTELALICNGSAFFRNEPEPQAHFEAWSIAKMIRRDVGRKARLWRRIAFRFTRVLP
jgi:hypothetical protein